MKYIKWTIYTTAAAEDIVSSVVFSNGISGVEIEDNENLFEKELKEMYVDIPINKQSDGKAKISFYVNIVSLEKKKEIEKIKNEQLKNINSLDLSYKDNYDNTFTNEEFENILNNIKNELNEYKSFMDLGILRLEKEELEDIDDLNSWKKNYSPIEIDDIVVKPNFLEDKKEYKDKLVINIEPGQAFGTGGHETTKLCIKAIKNIISNYDKTDIDFMDIGCGSGILGILAKKLNANRVINIDVDDNIKSNIIENYKLNDLSCDNLLFGNIVNDKKLINNTDLYNKDIIVANIISKVIISLLTDGNIHTYLKKGGYFIISGILKSEQTNIVDVINKQNNFTVVEINELGEWICLILKKK